MSSEVFMSIPSEVLSAAPPTGKGEVIDRVWLVWQSAMWTAPTENIYKSWYFGPPIELSLQDYQVWLRLKSAKIHRNRVFLVEAIASEFNENEGHFRKAWH